MKPKSTFKEYLAEVAAEAERLSTLTKLFEHEALKLIPGTRNSYAEHPGNTNTLTKKHAHVYAKPKGLGGQLYSASVDGFGHDGSSGTSIPSSHADFFRSKGYAIPANNILESLDYAQLDPGTYTLVILDDA